MNEKLEVVKDILKKYKQEHLLHFYDELNQSEQEKLLNQILEIDFKIMKELYENTKKPIKVSNDKIEPIEYIDKEKLTQEEKDKYQQIGEEIITSGRYAVATMAGGQRNKIRTSCTKRNLSVNKW